MLCLVLAVDQFRLKPRLSVQNNSVIYTLSGAVCTHGQAFSWCDTGQGHNSASPWFRMGENINGGLTEPTPVKIKMHLSYLHHFTEC